MKIRPVGADDEHNEADSRFPHLWKLAWKLTLAIDVMFNPLNAELNPICHLLALLGAHHILHVSRIRVKTVAQHLAAHVYVNTS